MTVVPKNLYSEDMPPDVRFRFSACRDCGAKTLDEAGDKCWPHSCPSGEYFCNGSDGDPFMHTSWDKLGRACVPTNAEMKKYAKRWEEFITEEVEREEALDRERRAEQIGTIAMAERQAKRRRKATRDSGASADRPDPLASE